MEDWVIEDEDMPLERKSLLPGKGFFVPDSVHEERKDREIREEAEGADVLVVADPDADGLACAAMVREVYGDAALVPAGPHEIEDGLRRVAEFGAMDCTVFVCDLCPDKFAYVEDDLAFLVEHAGDVHWWDHHQWTEETEAAVREAGVDLVIGDSEEECTADVAVRSIGESEVPRHLEELAAVTRDHDLWLKEDPRSDDLADYSYWVDADEYMDTVQEHGPDLPEDVMEFIEERRVQKNDLIDRAVDRASLKEVGEWTVGVTYGRCSQNEVAESLREQGADAAVVVKPSGSASIRGTESFERAHEVARQVNGGGHPKAAGCKPDIYEDMLDYANHWTSQGTTAKQVILDGFRNLEPKDEAADDETTESTDGDDAEE
ncbi:DHH family phosphoesterase [Halobacterium bonnevillei]|uniref:Recombinase RecJ n=1 Tax=Halobacterium bonnevillei TaxID=2692200 RepID=A0A6B0SSC0_9EURY|nr:recombinase RecJ [Halobacterium bonnevillei]MXR22451.1 recombinase RecJ [Halobacterium bonnevillei]